MSSIRERERDGRAAAPRGAADPGAGRAAARRRLMWTRVAFVAPAVVYLVAFFAYPIAYNVRMSLTDYTTTTFYTGVAPWVGLDNFRLMLEDPVFGRAFVNTALFTTISIAAQFVVGLGVALFFRKDFPGSSVLRSLMLLPWLLPLIVAATVWRWMLDQDSGVVNVVLRDLGLISQPIPWLNDGTWALASIIIVNVWVGIPFCMVILHAGMRGIPDELYEAASIDGASRRRQFAHITWPLLRPVTGVVLTLSLIYTLKSFDVIWVLTRGGPADATQTLATFSYVKSFVEFRFGQGAAIGDVLVLVSLVFGIFYLRSYRRSLREDLA